MSDNIIRTKGRSQGYKFDRGGTPAESGPYIGLVKNNVDPTRAGRLQVYIEQFGGPDENDKTLWRTVNYIPPFYGVTPGGGAAGNNAGTFTGNPQSYGMWFTPPDLGTQVICFFVAGDPNQGYYVGCVPDPGINHMLPAIGASRRFDLQNSPQASYFAGASQLPVTEINEANTAIAEDPRFFDRVKPVHSYLSGIMMQQGLIRDRVRGPITSNAQRESPSTVYGISTPGQAIYQGGLSERDIKGQLERGQLLPQDVKVIARRGGHSLVMDDGDLEGQDNLVRIRTARGHQITMSDDGDCFYIIHANGQTWLEFGKQGTVDVFSTNSVNIRTQGTLNLHADRDINMYAGSSINIKSPVMKLEAEGSLEITGQGQLTLYSKSLVGVKSDGTLNLKSSTGAWDAGSTMSLLAGCINLNSGGAAPVTTPPAIRDFNLADTKFVSGTGWTVQPGTLKTIVTRAPTHEPYPYHNQGVNSVTALSESPATALTDQTAAALTRVANVPVQGGIDSAALLSQTPAEISVGSLDTTQVTGLLAQTAADVGQAPDAVSLDKGIGMYGLSAAQLESAGFLKPGTVQNYLQPNPSQLTSVLASPSVWTGKGGVVNLPDLLTNTDLQSLTQNEVMSTALSGLQSAGVVTGREDPQQLAPFVQNAAKYGVTDTVAWIKGAAPPNIAGAMDSTAKNAQFAVNFVDTKASEVNTGLRLGGFTGTTDRAQLDQALTSIIGNPKVPTPNFSGGLYNSVPDSALTYSGDDPLVRDRINAERAARGLPPLGGVRI